MFLIQTYGIEDCRDYQPMTSNAHQSRWTLPSEVTSSSIFGYSSNGWKYGNASSYVSLFLETEIALPSSIEFQLNDYDNHWSDAPSFSLVDSNKSNALALFVQPQNGNMMFCGQRLSKTPTKGTTYRIELTETTGKLYENDVLLSTVNRTHHSVCKLRDTTGTHRYVQIKDFKVKPL